MFALQRPPDARAGTHDDIDDIFQDRLYLEDALVVVGVTGFEPAASSSRTRRATTAPHPED